MFRFLSPNLLVGMFVAILLKKLQYSSDISGQWLNSLSLFFPPSEQRISIYAEELQKSRKYVKKKGIRRKDRKEKAPDPTITLEPGVFDIPTLRKMKHFYWFDITVQTGILVAILFIFSNLFEYFNVCENNSLVLFAPLTGFVAFIAYKTEPDHSLPLIILVASYAIHQAILFGGSVFRVLDIDLPVLNSLCQSTWEKLLVDTPPDTPRTLAISMKSVVAFMASAVSASLFWPASRNGRLLSQIHRGHVSWKNKIIILAGNLPWVLLLFSYFPWSDTLLHVVGIMKPCDENCRSGFRIGLASFIMVHRVVFLRLFVQTYLDRPLAGPRNNSVGAIRGFAREMKGLGIHVALVALHHLVSALLVFLLACWIVSTRYSSSFSFGALLPSVLVKLAPEKYVEYYFHDPFLTKSFGIVGEYLLFSTSLLYTLCTVIFYWLSVRHK